MHLFTRRARLSGGDSRKALAWATDITTKAGQVSGMPIGLYTPVFSPGFGTLVWSTFVPDLAALESLGDKLNADDGYLDMADAGAAYTEGGIDDSLAFVVAGEPDLTRSVEYVSAVQAVAAGGHGTDAVQVGIELAQRSEAITGLATLFVTASTGPYGGVGWLTGYENISQLETAQQALLADPGWAHLIDAKAGKAYVEDPSATTQIIYRRMQ